MCCGKVLFHLPAVVIPVPLWQEESTRQTFGNALSTDWIPAFAGMAGVSKGIPSRITPIPALLHTHGPAIDTKNDF
jgi:hypothetical protein